MKVKAKNPVERRKLEKKALAEVRKKWKNRKGSVLTAAVMMTVVGSLVAGNLATQVSQDSSYSYHGELSQKALLIAEAGANEAIALLKENFAYKDDPSNFPETNLNDGSYNVTILEIGDLVSIISEGEVKGVERTVSVNVIDETGLEGLDFAFFSNDNMIIPGNSVVNGDIHSNENIEINGNPTINGYASSNGTITVTGSPTIDNTYEGYPTVDFPTFDFNYYYNLADPADRYFGNKNFTGGQLLDPVNGVIFVDGNVLISGNVTLKGSIVATGDITINGNVVHIGVEGLPLMMSRDGNIRVNGNVTQGDGILYAGTGDISVYGDVELAGQIIAYKELYLQGNVTVSGTGEIPGGFSGEAGEGFKIISYHE